METETAARFAIRSSEVLVHAAPDGSPDPARGLAPWPAETPDGIRDRFRLGPEAPDEVVVIESATPAPPGCAWTSFRSLVAALGSDAETRPAARAISLAGWRETARYCGCCSAATEDKPDETARICPECGTVAYPRVSPAVLTVVRRGDRILLARNGRFKGGIASLLAGFVESGESFEACVAREVREEVGIEVGPPRYCGSQPWPFPDSLMVGFECDWVSGELAPDGVEIVEAGWYGPDDHPPLPARGSLSRTLIDAALAGIAAAGRQDGT